MSANNALKEFVQREDVDMIGRSLMEVATKATPCLVSSFDPSTPYGRDKLVKATLLDCVPLKEVINKKLNITDFYVHDVAAVNDNGEVDEFSRIVIFDADGTTYQCAARGVAKSLAVLVFTRMAIPFDPPIAVEVKLKSLSDGRQWLTLIPDLASIGAIEHKKKKDAR